MRASCGRRRRVVFRDQWRRSLAVAHQCHVQHLGLSSQSWNSSRFAVSTSQIAECESINFGKLGRVLPVVLDDINVVRSGQQTSEGRCS